MPKFSISRNGSLLALAYISSMANNGAMAQQASRDIAGYSFEFEFSGAQVLGANGRFLHQEGSNVSLVLNPYVNPSSRSDASALESFELYGTILADNGQGAFFRFEDSGLCAVFLPPSTLVACQTPPIGGSRALTTPETEWVNWNADSIDSFFASLADKSAEERGRVAEIVSVLPTGQAAAFISSLANDLGESSAKVVAARATWAETTKLIGFDSEWASISALPEADKGIAAIINIIASAEILRYDIEVKSLRKKISASDAKQIALEQKIDQLSVEGDQKNQSLVEGLSEALANLTASEEKVVVLQTIIDRELATIRDISERDKQRSDELLAKFDDLNSRTAKLDEDLVIAGIIVGSLQTLVDTTSSKAVAFVQNRLNEYGYDPGEADGKMGQRTRDAIAAYQRAVNFPPAERLRRS